MIQTKSLLIGLSVSLAISSAALAQKSPATGGWNLNVRQGDNIAPSWIGVEGSGNNLKARFLGTAGSPGNADNVRMENDQLKWNAHGREWIGTIRDNLMIGTWKSGNEQGEWFANRSIHKPCLDGTWSVTFPDATGPKASLTINHGCPRITGTWRRGGHNVEITDAELDGNKLRFTINEQTVEAEVKGDHLEGKMNDGTELVGQRQREWGDPIVLFDGKNLDQWEGLFVDGMPWTIEDGLMTNGGHGKPNLVTKEKFCDFKLHVEFKVPEGGNSGVYLRGRHEIQVADSYQQNPSSHGCGAIYGRVAPQSVPAKKPGEWQTFEITLIGNWITMDWNGQRVYENQEIPGITGGAIDSHENKPGPIYLQGDHSQIHYRKIVLTPAR